MLSKPDNFIVVDPSSYFPQFFGDDWWYRELVSLFILGRFDDEENSNY